MDFAVHKDKLPISGHEVMQRFGYAHIVSHHTGKDSYAKRVYGDHYPRYHCYIKEQNGQVIFSLHVDQKQTSYAGSRAHNGEYDGPLVENEINNLKNHIVSLVHQERARTEEVKVKVEEKKIPWWKFF
jgi:hypothetical protein